MGKVLPKLDRREEEIENTREVRNRRNTNNIEEENEEKEVKDEEIKKAVVKMKIKKAAALDDIPIEIQRQSCKERADGSN